MILPWFFFFFFFFFFFSSFFVWWIKTLFLFSHSFFYFLFSFFEQKSLHEAAQYGNESAIKRLIQDGANVHLQDKVWFFYLFYLFFERINQFFFLFVFWKINHFLSLPSSFYFLEWKDTFTFCCITRTWKMCWIIDSKWCKCSYSRHGVIFYILFLILKELIKRNQFSFFSYFYIYFFSHLLFVY